MTRYKQMRDFLNMNEGIRYAQKYMTRYMYLQKQGIFKMNKETISIKRLTSWYPRHQHLSHKYGTKFKHVFVNMCIISSLFPWARSFNSDGNRLNVYYVPAEPMFTKRYLCMNLLYCVTLSQTASHAKVKVHWN